MPPMYPPHKKYRCWFAETSVAMAPWVIPSATGYVAFWLHVFDVVSNRYVSDVAILASGKGKPPTTRKVFVSMNPPCDSIKANG